MDPTICPKLISLVAINIVTIFWINSGSKMPIAKTAPPATSSVQENLQGTYNDNEFKFQIYKWYNDTKMIELFLKICIQRYSGSDFKKS